MLDALWLMSLGGVFGFCCGVIYTKSAPTSAARPMTNEEKASMERATADLDAKIDTELERRSHR